MITVIYAIATVVAGSSILSSSFGLSETDNIQLSSSTPSYLLSCNVDSWRSNHSPLRTNPIEAVALMMGSKSMSSSNSPCGPLAVKEHNSRNLSATVDSDIPIEREDNVNQLDIVEKPLNT